MLSELERAFVIPKSNIQALVADFRSRIAIVVTHPWGPLGGNMHNNVVVAAVLYFQNLGITTLRFDFQGSQIGRGNSQVTQVQEAAQFLLDGKHLSMEKQDSSTNSAAPPCYILLVGYSYGSLITASASASIPQSIGCISIAPPISVQHWLLCFNGSYHTSQARKRTSLPRLFVIGSRDSFTSEDAFLDFVTSFPDETTTGAVLKGADHFFHRREEDLMAIVGQWLVTTYPACGGDPTKLKDLEYHCFTNVAAVMPDPSNCSASQQQACNVGGSFLGCV